MKDITDRQVLEAVLECKKRDDIWPYELLSQQTGQPEKVCYMCMERACDRGFLEYGVSLRTAWITEKGEKLLNS